jgi:hypothetical protein
MPDGRILKRKRIEGINYPPMGQIRPERTWDVDSQPSVTKNILFKTSGLLLGGRRRGLGGMAGHKEAMWPEGQRSHSHHLGEGKSLCYVDGGCLGNANLLMDCLGSLGFG